MPVIRFILAAILGLLLVSVLQLADPLQNTPQTSYVRMPDVDISSKAAGEWKAGRHGDAILLLDYIVENRLPEGESAVRLRDGYLAVMQTATTPGDRLQFFGQGAIEANVDWFESLSGSSVADYFVYGGMSELLGSEAFKQSKSEFVQLLQSASVVSTLFPPAEPSMNLMKAAAVNGTLRPALVKQLSDILSFVRTAQNSSLAMTAIQDALMPVYQLAKKCRTWAEFETILKNASSIEQVKVLTRIAGSSPQSAKKMTQILIVANQEGLGLSDRSLSYVMRYGQKGLDNLYLALRKGAPGLQLALQHPDVSIQALNSLKGMSLFKDTALSDWWRQKQDQLGMAAVVIKYALAALLCILICMALVPPRILHAQFQSSDGVPLPAGSQRLLNRYYWAGVLTISISVCLLFLLRSVTPSPGVMTGATNSGTGTGPGMEHVSGATPGATLPEGNHVMSLTILIAMIVIVQSACWWAARRKIKEIEVDPSSDPRQKLRRLENLDIFYDLPLYCGLALTIVAFILITTFGAGVSRFLAYSATFVGIVFSVILRIGYLYPLRERLILQQHSRPEL